MPTEKELNPSPAEVSGEGKNETISATLGKDYGTLSPNPNFDDKNVEGEHATPVRVEKAAEVQPTEVRNSAQVLKLIKEYDEAHPVSSGTKLYKHTINCDIAGSQGGSGFTAHITFDAILSSDTNVRLGNFISTFGMYYSDDDFLFDGHGFMSESTSSFGDGTIVLGTNIRLENNEIFRALTFQVSGPGPTISEIINLVDTVTEL